MTIQWSVESVHEIRIGMVAHEDNWSYWEELIGEGQDIVEGRKALGETKNEYSSAVWAFRQHGEIEAAEARAKAHGGTISLRLPIGLWIDLMDQHGFLGDLEDMSGEKELRAIGKAHRRAAITIWKYLTAQGVEVRHPEHWWKY